jgi:hypothetical protein
VGGCDSCGESVGNEDQVDQMDKNKNRTDLLAAGRKKVFFGLLCLFILHSLEFPGLKLLIVVTFCFVAK